MSHKAKIQELFDQMAIEMLAFIKESESRYTGSWVPAPYIKDELGLKKVSYPKGNKTDKETGWLLATLARHLQDKGLVDFKKTGSRSFYKSKQ